MNKDAKIYVAGHRGLVGSAIINTLKRQGYDNFITKTHSDLDLTDQHSVRDFFQTERPEYVFLAAAKVGGIMANNTYPAEFIYDNLAIQTNIIHEAWRNKVSRLLFLGSSCIYPKECPQPIKEEYLLTGALEPTNRPYAIAKISGIEMCRSYNRQYGTQYLSVMPNNMYGPGDNFDLSNSHFLPALIRKMHEAKINGEKQVTIWGTGTPRRELLYSEDMADACVFLMNMPDKQFSSLTREHSLPWINIGTGQDMTITDIARVVAQVIGFEGDFIYDRSKPDGTMQKLLDNSRIHSLGWHPTVTLRDGISLAYQAWMDS